MQVRNQVKLSEIIGIILGDGHIHKTSNCITIVGSIEDLDYYQNYVTPLFKEVFGLQPKLRKRNDRNAYYLQLENKEIREFLTNEVGLSRGNKINAEIPPVVFESKENTHAFLRGIFDTDGSLKFSKQTKSINYYPRIQLAFMKSNLCKQIMKILEHSEYNFGSWETKYEISTRPVVFFHISGARNLERWNNEIGFSNKVHGSKYLFWKRFGHCIPKSSMESRLQALDLNKE